MKQVTLCVPLEVKPESCSRLTALVEELKRAEDKSANPEIPNFQRFHDQIPALHFMSMSVFRPRTMIRSSSWKPISTATKGRSGRNWRL